MSWESPCSVPQNAKKRTCQGSVGGLISEVESASFAFLAALTAKGGWRSSLSESSCHHCHCCCCCRPAGGQLICLFQFSSNTITKWKLQQLSCTQWQRCLVKWLIWVIMLSLLSSSLLPKTSRRRTYLPLPIQLKYHHKLKLQQMHQQCILKIMLLGGHNK